MKKQYITVFTVLFSLGACYGQLSPKVGGNPYLIESSAAFEVQSTTKGLLYPRMTTIERDAIGVAAAGLIIYNTTAACVQWYRGAANGGWFDPCAAVVPTITSTVTKRIWMDRNLGVDQGLDINTITSETDFRFYGSLYQWGRPSDGHEIIRWDSSTSGTPLNGSTETLSATNRPVSSLFISNSGGDWRSTQNDGLWQAGSQVNNPCPVGFRVPTIAEWEAETNITNSGSGFTQLKLVVAGRRFANGTFANAGDLAVYWSATVSGGTTTDVVRYLPSSADSENRSDNRANGVAVRCLKD